MGIAMPRKVNAAAARKMPQKIGKLPVRIFAAWRLRTHWSADLGCSPERD
jgi:hypothetical protein